MKRYETKPINLKGQRFGRLVAVRELTREERVAHKLNGASWFCNCDCGNVRAYKRIDLLGNGIKQPYQSCGCLLAETRAKWFLRTVRVKDVCSECGNGFLRGPFQKRCSEKCTGKANYRDKKRLLAQARLMLLGQQLAGRSDAV